MATKATKARPSVKKKKPPVNRALSNLMRQRDDLDFQIAEAKRTLRDDVRATVMQTIQASGFTVQELFGSVGTKVKRRSPGGGGIKTATYIDPDNPSNTWTGLGRQPNWLKTRLKTKGAKLEDFRTRS